MDRRHFLTAAGLVATGPLAVATPRIGPGEAFPVNAAPLGLLEPTPGPDPISGGFGLSLGYVPGSGESVLQDKQTTVAGAPHAAAEVSIFRLMPAPHRTIDVLAVTVYFAVQGPIPHVPYFAWQYSDGLGKIPRQSSPVTFSAALPQGALITLDYGVRGPGQAQNQRGSLTYRLGGTGLGPGTYVLAGPSVATGRAPIWADLVGTGDPGKLARRDGAPIDFDYLVIDVAPA